MTRAGAVEPEAEHRRLRWQCRRGMLELDLLLLAFIDRDYAHLSPEQQVDFRRLLAVEDQTLHTWLLSQAAPAEPGLRALVEQIRGGLTDAQNQSLSSA